MTYVLAQPIRLAPQTFPSGRPRTDQISGVPHGSNWYEPCCARRDIVEVARVQEVFHVRQEIHA
jgi:hypothetical protein